MFSLLRAALTLLICVLAVGFYLGWFSFTRGVPDPQTNKVNVNVSVDQKKIGTDLRTFEQNVAKRIQDVNNQPQGNNPTPPQGQQPAAPRLNLGPISFTPSGLPAQFNNGQQAPPTFSVGPFSVGPSNQAPAPPSSPPANQPQDFQFTVPLAVPPPGDGR